MRPVYSTRFIGATVPNGTSVTYQVPEGYVAVIKSFSGVIIGATTGGTAQLSVAGTIYLEASAPANAGVPTAFSINSMVVLNPGDTMVINATVKTECQVSGYLLTQ